MTDPKLIACKVNGAPVSSRLLGPPAMNYGQLHRWKYFERVEYEYVMALSHFIDHISPWFNQYREELEADRQYDAPNAETPEGAYADLGYPKIDQMLTKHSRLAQAIFLALPLELNNLFAPQDQSAIRYAANSVDRFSCDDVEIRFGGVAFDLASKNP